MDELRGKIPKKVNDAQKQRYTPVRQVPDTVLTPSAPTSPPQEILDHIVAQMPRDAAFSLRDASQAPLRDVLNLRRASKGLAATVDRARPDVVAKAASQGAKEFLRSNAQEPSPTLCQLLARTASLELIAGSKEDYVRDQQGQLQKRSFRVTPDKLERVLESTRNLKTLRIESTTLTPDEANSLYQALPPIRELSLKAVEIGNSSGYVDSDASMLPFTLTPAVCNSLQRLQLEGQFCTDTASIQEVLRDSPRLDELSLHPQQVRWLKGGKDLVCSLPERLQSLNLAGAFARDYDALSQATAKMAKLQSLRLSSYALDNYSAEKPLIMPSNKITRLELSGGWAEKQEFVKATLERTPFLRRFAFSPMSYNLSALEVFPTLSHLEHLELLGGDPEVHIGAFCSRHPQLQSLKVMFMQTQGLWSGSLLQISAPALRYLQVCRFSLSAEFLRGLDLRMTPNLEGFTLLGDFVDSPEPPPGFLQLRLHNTLSLPYIGATELPAGEAWAASLAKAPGSGS